MKNDKILGYICLFLGIGFLVGSIMIILGYVYNNSIVLAFGIVSPLLFLASICFCIGIKMKVEAVVKLTRGTERVKDKYKEKK